MALPDNVTGRAGYTPNYQALIQGDPMYMQAQGQSTALNTQNLAQLQMALQQALAQYGTLPDLSQYGFSSEILDAITPLARQLAAQNTANGLSTTAQLARAHTQNVALLRNQLAARGALSSGSLPYQTEQEGHNFAQGQQTALQQLLNAISQYQSSYLSSKQGIQGQLTQAMQDAYQRQLQLPQNQPRAAETYTYDVPTGTYKSDQYGTLKPFSQAGEWYLADPNGQARKIGPGGSLGMNSVSMQSLNTPLAPVAGKPSYAQMAGIRLAGAPGGWTTPGLTPPPGPGRPPGAPPPPPSTYNNWFR